MPTPTIRYPLDITGLNSDNFVEGEIHILSNKPVRAIAPRYGAFFTDSVVVFDVRTQKRLVRGLNYICTELLQTPTQMYGKEICYLILIIDPSVSGEVIIQYQLLGGLYTRSGDAILNIYETILQDNRPVNWIDVLNKPLEYTPTPHLHDGKDIYGLEYIATALERIRNAIVTSDVPAYESIMDWLNNELAVIKGQSYSAAIATTQEAIDGVVNDRLMTPLRVNEVLKKYVSNRAKNFFLAQI